MAYKLRKMRAQLIDPVTKKPVEDVDILTSADSVYFDDGETFEEKWTRGDFKGEPGEPGEDGVSATVQIGSVTTVDDHQDAFVENIGTKHAAVLNFAIPKGEKGEDGTSIKILGRFETYEELIETYPDGSDIDGGFLVGPEGGPCVYYFWNKRSSKWESMGNIQGPQGEKGDRGAPGEDGMGLAVLDSVENYQALIEKYPDGSVCNGMGVITLDTGEYWYWNILRNEWCSIGRITGIEGPKGDTGDAGTIHIYKVNTIDPAEEASVTNVGTDSNAQLVINIPRGEKGEYAEVDGELNPNSDNPISNKAVVLGLNKMKDSFSAYSMLNYSMKDLINLL